MTFATAPGYVQPPMNRWALIAGYQLTGLALAVSENLQRASVLPIEYRVTLKHTFVMLLAAGTVLGIIRVALRGVIGALKLRPEPCYALIAGVLSYLMWSELTTGAWISAQWYAPYLPAVLALAVAGGLWIATLLLRRLPAPKPALAPVVLALAACALAYADAHVLVGLYSSLHEALLLVLWLCGGEACAMAVAWVLVPQTHVRRRVALVVLACSLSLSVPIAWQKGTALQQRAIWMRAPGHAKVVYELGPSLVRSLLEEHADPRRPLVMAESLEIALVRGDHRVVLNPSAQLLQAFDESDPSAIKEVPLSPLPRLEQDFLLPLLGSPAASGNTSRLDEQ